MRKVKHLGMTLMGALACPPFRAQVGSPAPLGRPVISSSPNGVSEPFSFSCFVFVVLPGPSGLRPWLAHRVYHRNNTTGLKFFSSSPSMMKICLANRPRNRTVPKFHICSNRSLRCKSILRLNQETSSMKCWPNRPPTAC